MTLDTLCPCMQYHPASKRPLRVSLFAVFEAGNTSGQVAVIDLHGQHVAEALKLLQRELARLRGSFPGSGQNRQPAKSAGRRVQILVGNNSHSKVRPIKISHSCLLLRLSKLLSFVASTLSVVGAESPLPGQTVLCPALLHCFVCIKIEVSAHLLSFPLLWRSPPASLLAPLRCPRNCPRIVRLSSLG